MFDLPTVALPPMTTADFMDWPGDGTGRMFQLIDSVVRPVTPNLVIQGAILATVAWLVIGAVRTAGLPMRGVIRGAVVPLVGADTNVRLPSFIMTSASDKRGQIVVPDPVLMAEILSPANHDDTRSDVRAYFTLPSVQEVVVVDSARVLVEAYRRTRDGTGLPAPEVVRPGGRLRLATAALDCPVEDIYEQTWLAAPEA